MKPINRLAKYAINSADAAQRYCNMSRRAISLIPETTINKVSASDINNAAQFRQLLLNIEAKELSYCIKVSSAREKSRSAALVFRGRIVGCIYGNKHLKNQLFGQEAYNLMLAAGNDRDAKITTDHLREDFVLAFASLFSGNTVDINPNQTAQANLDAVYQLFIHSGAPGCIVMSGDDNLPKAIVYMFNGKIIGIFSYSENGGWVLNSYETAQELVSNTPRAQIAASCLAAKNVDEVYDISWAMSSLNNRDEDDYRGLSAFELSYALVTNYDHERLLKLVSPSSQSTFIEGCQNKQAYLY